MVDMNPLTRCMEIDSTIPVGHGETRLWSQGCLVLNPHLVVAVNNDLAVEARITASDPQPAEHRVAAVGLLGVGQRLEPLELDYHRGRTPPCGLLVAAHHESDGFAEELRLPIGEHGLIGVFQAEGLSPRDVLLGERRRNAGDS